MEDDISLASRVLQHLRVNRDNILKGNVNCIPSPLTRFRRDFVGIQRGMYYLISASQKCGKTQFASSVFLYSALDFAFKNPDKIRLKVMYYPLEETKEKIMTRYMSHLL